MAFAQDTSCAGSRKSQLDGLVAANQLVIFELERLKILTPGFLTVNSSGELKADLASEHDQGTMAGLYEDYSSESEDSQIPSWLRDFLLDEIAVQDRAPPTACCTLYEVLDGGKDELGQNPSVKTIQLLLLCATSRLKRSISEVRDFVEVLAGTHTAEELDLTLLREIVNPLFGRNPGDHLPDEVRLVLDLYGIDKALKGLLAGVIETEVLAPYSSLLQKLSTVAASLRRQLEKEEGERSECGYTHSQDSGIDV